MFQKLRIVSVLTILLVVFGRPAFVLANSKDGPAEPAETIVFLIDQSGSIKEGLPPNTIQAFVTQAIQVAIISNRPVKMAVVMLSGKGVKVLGDDNDMPTSALKTLHRRVLNEWQEPEGGTPLDEALGLAVNMVRAATGPVTVVNFGDGCPATALQPDKYQSVREAIDKKIDTIRNLGRPPRITQQSIDQFLHVLNSPLDWTNLDKSIVTECKRIHDLQRDVQFELCKRHAAALRGAKARFISVDFGGGIQQLREIHDAAGGLDSDYLVVEPTDVIGALHDVGLLQLERIIVPKPIRVPSDTSTFSREFDVPFGTAAEAGLVTIVFDQPIEDFSDHFDLRAEAGGVTYTFDVQNNDDPNTNLSFDSNGRVATATLVLPSIPSDGTAQIRFNSPRFSMSPPGMTVFTHLRLSANLEPILRPDHIPADEPTPYPLAPNRRSIVVGWLGVKDDPKPVPIVGMEPVWKNRQDGQLIRLEMESDPQRPGVFRSANELQMPPGQYDVEINFLLESGAQFKLKIPMHLHCQRFDEHITVEITDSSKSPAHMDGGELGDAVQEYELTVIFRSRNLDYPIPIQLRVVGLMDEDGHAPEKEWVFPVPGTAQLLPGRPTPVKIKFKLPDVIEDSLVDGLFVARLQCLRTDINTTVELRPFKDVFAPIERNVDEVTFVLKRPKFAVSAPRGPMNELTAAGDDHWTLTIHNNVGLPLRRTVLIEVTNTSDLPRRIDAKVMGQFRNAREQYVDGVTLESVQGNDETQEISPGAVAKFRFVFNATEGEDCHTSFRISAPSFTAMEIPVFYKAHKPFRGQTMQAACYGLAVLLVPLALLALVFRFKNARLGTGKSFTLKPDKPADTLSVQAAGRRAARLLAEVPYQQRRANDKRARRMPRQRRLTAEDLDQGNPLHVIEQHPEHAGIEIVFDELEITEDGEPRLPGRIVDGGRFQQRANKFGKSFRRRLFVAVAVSVLGYYFLHPSILAAAQFVWDVLSGQ